MIEQNPSSVSLDKPSTCSKIPSGHLVELLAVTSYPSAPLYPSNVLDIGTFSPFMNQYGEMDCDSSSYRRHKTSFTVAQG
jgi:hypothetical protein